MELISQSQNKLKLVKAIPVIIAVVAIISLGLWLRTKAGQELAERVPGTDNVIGEEPSLVVEGDVFAGNLVISDGVPADLPGSWPRFRSSDIGPTPSCRREARREDA